MAPLPVMIELLCKLYKSNTALYFTPANMRKDGFFPKIKQNCELMQ